MPNIEIHGIGKNDAIELRNRIYFDLFCSKPYIFDIVITIVINDTQDVCRENQPFLRVYATPNNQYADEIENVLRGIGLDIERIELKKFVAGKKKPTTKMVFAEIWRRPLGAPAHTLALALFNDAKPNTRLKSILQNLVNEGMIEKTGSGRNAVYKTKIKNLNDFPSDLDVFLSSLVRIAIDN